ncbi:hypothetical protein AB1Y20_001593 [Prymnesium parvum]|uniref:Calponin-homology (CH) domain-containing protein n=1 Tax=Prymnesium parvum TaxID=97485 RepID=A0AB34KDQ9_PRYPA
MRWHECATEHSERQAEQALVDEINSLPLKSCVLLESLEEFRDGTIFLEMLHAAIRIQGLEAELCAKAQMSSLEVVERKAPNAAFTR